MTATASSSTICEKRSEDSKEALPPDHSKRIGRYRLIKRLAGGGSSEVHEALSPSGETVAIKILDNEVAKDETRLLRFYQEGRSLLQLSQENVVKALEIGEDNGTHYVAMELVCGRTLAEYLMCKGRLDEATALKITICLARALVAAHQNGIIHRDVSPKNVMLADNGQVKLGDFEFAKKSELDLDLTMQGTGLGTPDFMSPEQFLRAKDVDARTDLYSLGVVLYVMVTARLPFPGKTFMDKFLPKSKNHYLPPSMFNGSLTPATVGLIKRAMSSDPESRPATAQEFAKLAQRCLESLEFQQSQRQNSNVSAAELWKVAFITRQGRSRGVRLSDQQLVQLISQNRLPADARACRDGQTEFRLLCEIPEFQHLFHRSLSKAVQNANEKIVKRGGGLLARFGQILQTLGKALAHNA